MIATMALALDTLTYLIFKTIQQDRNYYSHCGNEGIEGQTSSEIPQSPDSTTGLEPSLPAP